VLSLAAHNLSRRNEIRPSHAFVMGDSRGPSDRKTLELIGRSSRTWFEIYGRSCSDALHETGVAPGRGPSARLTCAGRHMRASGESAFTCVFRTETFPSTSFTGGTVFLQFRRYTAPHGPS